VQRKLYARSRDNPDYRFEELWGLVTDPRNLRVAFNRVSRNRGARTAGIDRITVRRIVQEGSEEYLVAIRKELRSGSFHPSPVRRVLIPKAGKPGVFRPLGIPTVKDRTIQAAMKQIMEPIFEAGFYPTSYGFRPGRSVRGALAHLKTLLLPRGMKRWKTAEKPPFQWAVEGDIKGCFDQPSQCPPQEPTFLSKVSSFSLPALSLRSAASVAGLSGKRYNFVRASRASAMVPLWMRS
jgi:retron-type reverse transcriptase